jgi:Protein of unknown function (DUF3313)
MMIAHRCSVALILALSALACSAHRRTPPDMSGFLDDYGLLRPGGPNEVRLVYRNPATDWRRYHAVMLEPVTIWRSGRKSLDAVPQDDLLRLARDFELAVRSRLGRGFRLVDRAGPGVLRIRLGITQARASDPILDVVTVPPADETPPAGSNPLDPETRRFLDAAVIEGELVDAETGELVAQGVDGPRRADAPPLDTWADVDRGLARWADRVSARLEARTGTEAPAAPR